MNIRNRPRKHLYTNVNTSDVYCGRCVLPSQSKQMNLGPVYQQHCIILLPIDAIICIRNFESATVAENPVIYRLNYKTKLHMCS